MSEPVPDAADLDAQVRRADPDRWLASRFVADPERRGDLIALYAFNQELARAGEMASNPLLAEIRLTWWSEAVAELAEGRTVRRHPVTLALAAAVARGLDAAALDALVEGRFALLEAASPERPKRYTRVCANEGRLMAAAAAVLAPGDWAEGTRDAGRAWGYAGLWRRQAAGLPSLLPGWTAEETRGGVDAALRAARAPLRGLPAAAFPAVAYVTLAPAYLRSRPPGELEKRARLTWATLTGRL